MRCRRLNGSHPHKMNDARFRALNVIDDRKLAAQA
jgi:hypothetical protein